MKLKLPNVLYKANKLTGFNSNLKYVEDFEEVKFNDKNKINE